MEISWNERNLGLAESWIRPPLTPHRGKIGLHNVFSDYMFQMIPVLRSYLVTWILRAPA